MATILFCRGVVATLMILHSANTAFDPNVCVGKPSQFFADPTDVKGFYSCEGGHTVHHSCQKGEVFEPKVGNCVVPLTAPSPGFCILKHDSIYKDPTNKAGFYKCVSGVTFYQICQRPLLFNSSASTCEPEASPQPHTVTMPPLKLWRMRTRRSPITTARKETRDRPCTQKPYLC
ncbi:uncharacterized protein LOC121299526 isoform X2 [Polyodon spathula]|uniref:uncharacterized protein LOC121299526 isoform X2 n=1 Tax=Polyodon spathula TaxID=7913 RepID=UPI001B7EA823|nr:uncharacterized protein LOC121299526 isoform X2 [Polyodon spathula]